MRFECQPGCTKCCDMEGAVYLSETDIRRAAKFVRMSPKTFEAKYIYRTRHLPLLHRDPFDRLLVAQTLTEGLTMLTADRLIRKYKLPLIWAARRGSIGSDHRGRR